MSGVDSEGKPNGHQPFWGSRILRLLGRAVELVTNRFSWGWQGKAQPFWYRYYFARSSCFVCSRSIRPTQARLFASNVRFICFACLSFAIQWPVKYLAVVLQSICSLLPFAYCPTAMPSIGAGTWNVRNASFWVPCDVCVVSERGIHAPSAGMVPFSLEQGV